MGFQCFRHQISLYADIFDSENKHKSKRYFFYFYFSIVHISSNNVLGSLKLYMHVGNIHVEGTVSQMCFHILVSILCPKKSKNFLFIF